ncbi:hypothetical protein [uncultured Paraglaciecola sp.]|uniref:hypothetical protein n=1 Tax=uncultured Paraglaciecola sp. TaxID=1765024 RepID=UPI002612658E|nr:hypothetical protein [uncultured Paraglaciecola sp.]
MKKINQASAGDIFGKRVAIGESFKEKGHLKIAVQCECGREGIVRVQKLVAGEANQCAWCASSERATIHGMTGTSIFNTWSSMIERCRDVNHTSYADYGGRGIRVCNRWQEFSAFYADMGEKPSKSHSIERIDNNKGYSPENCTWATKKEQARNRRSNATVEHDGKCLCLSEWAEITGIARSTICNRLGRGWSFARAIGAEASS